MNPSVNYVNIGSLDAFIQGGGMPEGNYACSYEWMLYQATKRDGSTAGPARLGIMVTAHSLDDAKAEPRTQFYSGGSKAHESFMPDPAGGKRLVPVAGGTGASGLPMNTNYYFYIKSLYDSGLPQGIFVNDISVLDGIHVHVHNIAEPEERKAFASAKTSEVADEPRKSNTISVVSEILEGGSPWEGGGGIPDKTAKKPAAKAAAGKGPVTVAKAPVKAAGKAVPAPAAAVAVATELSEEDMLEMATAAITSVLEAEPDGCMKIKATTGVFKSIAKDYDDDTASNIITTFFKDADVFNSVIEPLGYVLKGLKVIPITE